jgi:hypothetical protein
MFVTASFLQPHGYRYPGSLIVRVLVNKYYALQRKYRRESTKPGV